MNHQSADSEKTMMQIIDDSSLGGAENHTRLISKEFARRGYKIVIICPPGPYVKKLRELESTNQCNVEVLVCADISKHYMNPLYGFDLVSLSRAARFIKQCIRSKNIGVIHSHKHPVDLLVALSTKDIKGLKIITTIHSMENKDKFCIWRLWRYAFIKYALSKFDYIFAVSESVRINTVRYFDLSPQKVVTMMNGTDLSELIPKISKEHVYKKYDISSDEFVIVCAAKLEHRKGQDVLIRAVASVLNSKNNQREVVLLLAGDSNNNFKNKLNVLCKELGIESNVKLLEYISNITDILQIADLYVQPSRWDPLPRALIEAMGIGIASVGSRVDGISELIEHDKTGLLFKNEDTFDLALQIKKAMKFHVLRKSYADESIKKIKRFHTTCNMVDTIESHLFGANLENRS